MDPSHSSYPVSNYARGPDSRETGSGYYTRSSLSSSSSHRPFDPVGQREHVRSTPRHGSTTIGPALDYGRALYQHAPQASPHFATPPNESQTSVAFQPQGHGLGMKRTEEDFAEKGNTNTHLYRDGPQPAPSREMSHPSQPYDQLRRRSVGSNGSSSAYSAHQEHPPPPPTTVATYPSRQMLPPSSPQHYQPRGAPIQHPPQPSIPAPSASSYASRDQLLQNQPHRPGSSMTISSMLGAEADRPPRENVTNSLYPRVTIPSLGAGVQPQPPPPPPSQLPPQLSTQQQPAAMSPPSAPTRQSASEGPTYRRSHTPDRGTFSKPPTPRPYRSRSSGNTTSISQPATDDTRYSGLSSQSSSSSHPQQYGDKAMSGKRSPRSSYLDAPYQPQDRRLSLNTPASRNPPQLHHQTEEPQPRSSLFSPTGRYAAGFGEGPTKDLNYQREQQGYSTAQEPPARPSSRFSTGSQERHHQESSSHEVVQKYGTQELHHHHHLQQQQQQQQPQPQPQHQQQPPSRYGSLHPEHENDRSRRASWDPNYRRASPESTRYTASEANSNYGYGSVQNNYSTSLGTQSGPPRSVPGLQMQRRQESAPSNELSGRNEVQPSTGVFSPGPSSSGPQVSHSTSFGEQLHRPSHEEPPPHRNVLNLSVEARRGGRVSPLPQAVQGAQAQIIDPSSEPGIKSELGRVFSGIGSGVGVSTTASLGGSGPSTPLTSSPFKKDMSARPMSQEINDVSRIMGSSASNANARRGRKANEDDTRDEMEVGAGQRDVSTNRGRPSGRRPRHRHHHHHHHKHKIEDDSGVVSQPSNSQLKSPFRPQSVVGDGISAPAPPHHHHHHHHHHHVPRAIPGSIPPYQSSSAVPPKEYSTTVNLEPLLKSVSHLPRSHLGSMLYAPRISMPSARAPPESAKFGYKTTPVPIPRFDEKENCTFTIRVPRFRIDALRREEICARRALWGTGVYTDDSDPVAAAIHSGFVRGEWAEEVDVSMLDLEIKEPSVDDKPTPTMASSTRAGANATTTAGAGSAGKQKNIGISNGSTPSANSNSTQSDPASTMLDNATPAHNQQEDEYTPANGLAASTTHEKKLLPPLPPPDKDLHIKLLILPTLQQYDSSVRYGLKSRSWGKNHDGMSFKIESIEWVDEGASKGEERGGEARRKRLRNMMKTGRICTAAGLKGRRGVELKQGPRAQTAARISEQSDSDVQMTGIEQPAATATVVDMVPSPVDSAT
ncbi:hypothetical protein FQN57_005111 [Myotisia sp. PD_48]|nr:hypothetical protein FQN57_005111 [Myotisia sp. PD_48]